MLESFAAVFPRKCEERLDDVIHGVLGALREGRWPRRHGNLCVGPVPTIHVAFTRSSIHPIAPQGARSHQR